MIGQSIDSYFVQGQFKNYYFYNIIKSLNNNFEDHSQTTENGIEFWFARDLQQLLGYTKWDNFKKVFHKSKISCEATENDILDHFAYVGKMVKIGSGTEREIDDIMKKKMGVPKGRALADFLPTITIKAKDFATEITVFNTKEKGLSS